ncbi:MAG: hypothetical protein LQ347_004751 [Umbilicaria vellea]|nr:MAG: hypothetical protein LQ347_004751 [Umbilicaria vellea]
MFAIFRVSTDEEKEQKAEEMVEALEKEVEPLLKDANPYFGGKGELTLVEVQCAPFILRLYDFADGHILPASLPASLDKLPNFAKWAKACRTHESVVDNWDAELRRVRARESMARYKARAAAAAAAAVAG